jgi:hypothetical protein
MVATRILDLAFELMINELLEFGVILKQIQIIIISAG